MYRGTWRKLVGYCPGANVSDASASRVREVSA